MIAPSPDTDDLALDLATESLYRFLSAVLGDPRSGQGQLLIVHGHRLAIDAADLLREEFGGQAVPLGLGEAPIEDLNARPLVREIEQAGSDLPAEYVRVFGFISCRECPPYETEFHANSDTFFRMQQVADVAGFYRAFGLAPGSEARERPDQLSLELEFMAYLLMKQRLTEDRMATEQVNLPRDICHQARAVFFRDHVSWWLPAFCLALRRKAKRGPYAAAARLLAALLPVERTRLGVAAPQLPLVASVQERSDECEGCQLAR